MIKKYYEVSCDNCRCAIGQYIFAPLRNAKEHDDAIVKKGKHFCGKGCCDEYFKRDNQELPK